MMLSPARQLAVNRRFEREFEQIDPLMKEAIRRAFVVWLPGVVYDAAWVAVKSRSAHLEAAYCPPPHARTEWLDWRRRVLIG